MRPGSATAFEHLVDDYDAARPTYPGSLYDALPPLAGRDVLELGTGTGLATAGLLEAGARVVATDLGPKMLGRARQKLGLPSVVARAEALPFNDRSFDLVTGAQMWHWVDVPAAAAEAARVLRRGGSLAVFWNEVDAAGEPWFEQQQDRLEAADPAYTRTYRERPYDEELRQTGRFAHVSSWTGRWARTLDWPLYARWLRSKSYVAQLDDPEAFLAAERASLLAAFPDGRIVEPFRVVLHVATVA
ncbi:MAG: Methyltransferase type 11 [Frankiales bacterium]|nr:Methyltransferase type 11 [Frankiales bacterium]